MAADGGGGGAAAAASGLTSPPQRDLQRERGRGDLRQIRVSMEVLGRGGFGKVCMGLTEHGDLVAVKEISVCTADPKDIEAARGEYELLKRLSHPNIVHVLDFSFDEQARAARIVMEYVPGGSLARVISSLGQLPERAVRNYTAEILQGLDYLHTVSCTASTGILHRDIKPHNILLRTEPGSDGAQVKLADFGLCTKIREKSSRSQEALVGTVPYMSPQSIKGTYSRQSDIWATGCTVLEMATGEAPWAELGFKDAVPFMFHIGTVGSEGQTPRIPDRLSAGLRGFLLRCFAAERDGFTCADLRQQPFFTAPDSPVGGSGGGAAAAAGSGDVTLESVEERHAAVLVQVSHLLRETDASQRQLGDTLRNPGQPHWAFVTTLSTVGNLWGSSSTGFGPPASVSGAQAPHGPVFREDLSLPWEKFWSRCSQLPKFTAVPFQSRYAHVLPLVKYIMCGIGMDDYHTDEVSYNDDFCPLAIYFRDIEGMFEDIAELNRRCMFLLGANTATATAHLEESRRGAMLIRPSKRERGKLAVTVRLLRQQVLETRHFLVVRQADGSQHLTLFGAASCPEAPTLLELIDRLRQRAGDDFRHGAGRREERREEAESAYAGGAYQQPHDKDIFSQ